MSLWAYNTNGDIVNLVDDIAIDINADYRCPSCGCKMYYKSASSNGRAAHFAGHHNSECDIGHTSDVDGKLSDYYFDQTTLSTFLESLMASGVKTIKKTVSADNMMYSETKGHVTIKNPNKKKIRTLRQLFNVLASSSPDATIYSTIKVKDIYCGSSTEYLYTTYINGLHLVYAQYNGYSRYNQCLYLKYPSCKRCNVTIRVYIEDALLFSSIVKSLVGHTQKFVLLFSVIDGNHCRISSAVQLVPLRS